MGTLFYCGCSECPPTAGWKTWKLWICDAEKSTKNDFSKTSTQINNSTDFSNLNSLPIRSHSISSNLLSVDFILVRNHFQFARKCKRRASLHLPSRWKQINYLKITRRIHVRWLSKLNNWIFRTWLTVLLDDRGSASHSSLTDAVKLDAAYAVPCDSKLSSCFDGFCRATAVWFTIATMATERLTFRP